MRHLNASLKGLGVLAAVASCGAATGAAHGAFLCDAEFVVCMRGASTRAEQMTCRQAWRLCNQTGYFGSFAYTPEFDGAYGQIGGVPWVEFQSGGSITVGVGREATDGSGFLSGPGEVDGVMMYGLPSRDFGVYDDFSQIPFQALGAATYNIFSDRWEFTMASDTLAGDGTWVLMAAVHDPTLPFIPELNDGTGVFHGMIIATAVPGPGAVVMAGVGMVMGFAGRRRQGGR